MNDVFKEIIKGYENAIDSLKVENARLRAALDASWIKAGERLPEYGSEVNVCVEGKVSSARLVDVHATPIWFPSKAFWDNAGEPNPVCVMPEHRWQPLPESAKE